MQSTTKNSNEQIQIPCHVTRKAAIDVSEHSANVPTKLAVAVAVAVAGWIVSYSHADDDCMRVRVYVCMCVYVLCCTHHA
jgi:hypothetical protein